MKTVKSFSFEEANTNSQEIFNAVNGKIGMVPNLYAAMGVSDKLLGSLEIDFPKAQNIEQLQ